DDGDSPGPARIFVSPGADALGDPYAWESVEMTDGVSGTDAQRRYEPRISVYREPLLNGGDKSTAAGAVIGAGTVTLVGKPANSSATSVDRATFQAEDRAIVLRDRNGRVRFRK